MSDKVIKGLLISTGLGLSACTVNSSDYNVRVDQWENSSERGGAQLQTRFVPEYNYHFIWMGMREIDYIDRLAYRVINNNTVHMCVHLQAKAQEHADYRTTPSNRTVVSDLTVVAPKETRSLGFYQLYRGDSKKIEWGFDAFEAIEDTEGFHCREDEDCYITTAMCRDTGKPDDCAELQSLRKYRDEVMLNDSEGRALVKEYYLKAPKIVSLINQEPDHRQIYQSLREHYIVPAAQAADAGDNAKALELYRTMVESLSQKYERFI